jgi:hypothetical protein
VGRTYFSLRSAKIMGAPSMNSKSLELRGRYLKGIYEWRFVREQLAFKYWKKKQLAELFDP